MGNCFAYTGTTDSPLAEALTVAGPVLVFEHAGKVFHDHEAGTEAVRGLTLTVTDGAFVALTGPSGCGKSTVLRMAADLTTVSSGTVRVCGQPPVEARRQRQLGMVFQSPVLMEWRTVADNVSLPLEIAGVPRDVRRRQAEEVLELVGLRDVVDRYPHQLSGGMRQRAAIARALVTRPKVLLMDEPFAALDEITRERLNLELLRIWADTGVTVLFVTHHVEEAVFLSDEVVVLSARPGTVADRIPVPLPRPRNDASRRLPDFFATVNRVRSAQHSAAAVAASPPQ